MNELFSLKGKVAVITGVAGVLGGSLARHFASQGAVIVGLVHRPEQVRPMQEELGPESLVYACDVLDLPALETIAADAESRLGRIDILINVAGGNVPGATIMPEANFFDMDPADWKKVVDLNLNGTVYPTLVFSRIFARQKEGCILNISSMAAYGALSRVGGYGAAKSGVSNFTQWLAAEMAMKYSDRIRVNALAPGFFIGKQNRSALLNPDGTYTDRSKKVIAKTPMGRFGNIDELNGAAQFLCSDAAAFITGVVLPVDGGFSSFSGV